MLLGEKRVSFPRLSFHEVRAREYVHQATPRTGQDVPETFLPFHSGPKDNRFRLCKSRRR